MSWRRRPLADRLQTRRLAHAASMAGTWPGRPLRPQLPLYGLAHAESLRGLAYVVLAAGAVEYRGWSDGSFVGEGVLPYPAGVRLRPGHPLIGRRC